VPQAHYLSQNAALGAPAPCHTRHHLPQETTHRLAQIWNWARQFAAFPEQLCWAARHCATQLSAQARLLPSARRNGSAGRDWSPVRMLP